MGLNIKNNIAGLLGGLTAAANKIPYFVSSSVAGVLDFLDEDDFSSDSATGLASQQSIKAYVDGRVDGIEGTLVWDVASLDDGEGETSGSVTATGAVLGDYVMVSAPHDMQGIILTGYVDAADSVKLRVQNETGGTINLASGTYKVRVIAQ